MRKIQTFTANQFFEEKKNLKRRCEYSGNVLTSDQIFIISHRLFIPTYSNLVFMQN